MRERTGVCEGEALWERKSVYVRENMREINYEWKGIKGSRLIDQEQDKRGIRLYTEGHLLTVRERI
jgi:hypothetical protein